MNKTQLALAIESIEGDCDIRGSMKDRLGQTCALGGLAESAGFDAGMGNDRYYTVIADVSAFYGLQTNQTRRIMSINDRYVTKKARQRNIIKFLRGLVT